MQDNLSNNKRIAKNTLFLYFRTILIMLVTLYTSRVVLNTLGIEDYGVYNAVGGVVTMFAVISGALSNAISRYITYGIGKGDKEHLKVIFCTSINIQIIISLIVFVLCEVIGLWFLNTKMNIPIDRLTAATWVLHCSLLTFVVNLISVPYNACIIAHEHMNAYAYISIFDAILKLMVAYLLIISPVDKLIAYSVLLLLASFGIRLLYVFYCGHHFRECKYKMVYDRKLFREMLGFAGWNFLTNGASVLNSHGVSILINVFWGVIANSARGIASQIEAATYQFVNSFTTAVNPQIIKSYAQGDKQRMFYLICKGAKFSYLLLLVFAVPIYMEVDKVLELWLINVPEDASLFVKLSLLGALITVLGNTGYTACMATGDIKQYSIWITSVGSLAFFLTWIAYKCGASVEASYVIYIFVYMAVQVVRLLIMRGLFLFPIGMYMREVILRIFFTTILAPVIPWLIVYFMPSSFLRVLLTFFASVVWSSICIYICALTKGERVTIMQRVSLIAKKVFRKQ